MPPVLLPHVTSSVAGIPPYLRCYVFLFCVETCLDFLPPLAAMFEDDVKVMFSFLHNLKCERFRYRKTLNVETTVAILYQIFN